MNGSEKLKPGLRSKQHKLQPFEYVPQTMCCRVNSSSNSSSSSSRISRSRSCRFRSSRRRRSNFVAAALFVAVAEPRIRPVPHDNLTAPQATAVNIRFAISLFFNSLVVKVASFANSSKPGSKTRKLKSAGITPGSGRVNQILDVTLETRMATDQSLYTPTTRDNWHRNTSKLLFATTVLYPPQTTAIIRH